MTQPMKKFGLLLILAFTSFFSSCEKDLYEEAIQTQNENKINVVSINEVPSLIPSIQKYNARYNFLSDSNIAYRGIEDLNLNLEKIIEYVKSNELKSYSIAIQNDFSDKEDYYLENLHIIKENDKYETFIAKYNAADDSKTFDLKTFTGQIEISNVEGEILGIINYTNGQAVSSEILIDVNNQQVLGRWPVTFRLLEW